MHVHSSITIPPGNHTELGFVQALDQQFNTTTNGVIRAEYDSTNNIGAIYTTSETTAFRIRTDEEVQIHYNNGGNTMNEILNNIVNPSPVYRRQQNDYKPIKVTTYTQHIYHLA